MTRTWRKKMYNGNGYAHLYPGDYFGFQIGAIPLSDVDDIADRLTPVLASGACARCAPDGLAIEQIARAADGDRCRECRGPVVCADEPEFCRLDNDGPYRGGTDLCNEGRSPWLYITQSPYYTLARYLGMRLGDLTEPIDDGSRTYCLGHEVFEDGIAPYPVFRVSDDTEVSPTPQIAEIAEESER